MVKLSHPPYIIGMEVLKIQTSTPIIHQQTPQNQDKLPTNQKLKLFML